MPTIPLPTPRRPTRDPAPPPEHLAAPEADLWRQLVADYRFADAASLALLQTALEARQRARRCREAIDRDGEAVRDRFDQVRAHPLLTAERDGRAAFFAGMKLLRLDLGDQK